MEPSIQDSLKGLFADLGRSRQRFKLNFERLSEEERNWLKKISEKSDLLKNPKQQRRSR